MDGIFETVELQVESKKEIALENNDCTVVIQYSNSKDGNGVQMRETELERLFASVKDENAGLLLEVGSLSIVRMR